MPTALLRIIFFIFLPKCHAYGILNSILTLNPYMPKIEYLRIPFETLLKKKTITGNPDAKHISTSYVERQNLTMRMHMRRFTRLTNAFSKKVENHALAVALHMMYYNFVRIHKTLRVTPAMAAGVSDRLWEIGDIVALVEAVEAEQPRKRGPYKKKVSE